MLAGLEGGEDVDLIESSFFQLGVLLKLLRLHHLYGHLLLVLHVDGLVHCGVHPPSDFVQQLVVLNHFPHLRINQ